MCRGREVEAAAAEEAHVDAGGVRGEVLQRDGPTGAARAARALHEHTAHVLHAGRAARRAERGQHVSTARLHTKTHL